MNEQVHTNRWLYEIQNMVKMILADDHTENNKKICMMIDVIEVLESARKSAGILFPACPHNKFSNSE